MIITSVLKSTNAIPSNPVYSKNGDVLVPASDTTPTGLARASCLEKSGVLLGGDINIIRPRQGINGSCLSLAINHNKRQLIRLIKGTTVKHIHNSDLSTVVVALPKNLDEQREIVNTFKNLDNLITLHQRELDSLKKLKKSLLQKMFPKNGEKIPELRFPEFTGDWEQRKFGDMTIRESKTGESSKNLPCVEYEDVVCDNGVLNKDLSLKDAIKKGILFDGSQVLYGKLRPYLHNWLLPDFKGVAVGDWWVLRPKGVDKKFIYRLIQTQQFDDVTNLSSGSKMPRADWKLVSNTEFAIPCSTEEQMKIGLYFEHLDNLITLHQRELDSLKKLKKGLLQNMFV